MEDLFLAEARSGLMISTIDTSWSFFFLTFLYFRQSGRIIMANNFVGGFERNSVTLTPKFPEFLLLLLSIVPRSFYDVFIYLL